MRCTAALCSLPSPAGSPDSSWRRRLTIPRFATHPTLRTHRPTTALVPYTSKRHIALPKTRTAMPSRTARPDTSRMAPGHDLDAYTSAMTGALGRRLAYAKRGTCPGAPEMRYGAVFRSRTSNQIPSNRRSPPLAHPAQLSPSDRLLRGLLKLPADQQLVEDMVSLVEIEDQVELAHVAKIAVENLDKMMYRLEHDELVILFIDAR
eukprot:CAMPEP_0119374080 /NCGR_PEP_ID=MMETSP1334-20130426/28861_1 /TAXON_ID=127549 /ORGANISM="Calcidiscus leptoporus, Strain RCC1130" /LENGTH=205 /DNA_ID=CAMNT_0007392033 /DNA_START=287 /DNA_END=906 /DNA_ORIENTATION=-